MSWNDSFAPRLLNSSEVEVGVVFSLTFRQSSQLSRRSDKSLKYASVLVSQVSVCQTHNISSGFLWSIYLSAYALVLLQSSLGSSLQFQFLHLRCVVVVDVVGAEDKPKLSVSLPHQMGGCSLLSICFLAG